MQLQDSSPKRIAVMAYLGSEDALAVAVAIEDFLLQAGLSGIARGTFHDLALEAVSAETGKTVPQIALNWLLQRPSVASIIIGARNEEQLRQNLGAVGWKLSLEQIAFLDRASETPKIYPYWHQAGFSERNPFPVG